MYISAAHILIRVKYLANSSASFGQGGNPRFLSFFFQPLRWISSIRSSIWFKLGRTSIIGSNSPVGLSLALLTNTPGSTAVHNRRSPHLHKITMILGGASIPQIFQGRLSIAAGNLNPIATNSPFPGSVTPYKMACTWGNSDVTFIDHPLIVILENKSNKQNGTGFPFKTIQIPGIISIPEQYPIPGSFSPDQSWFLSPDVFWLPNACHISLKYPTWSTNVLL